MSEASDKYAYVPRDPELLKAMVFDLPRLKPDSADSCPCSRSEIQAYADAESAFERPTLRFVRTADIDDVKYWLWEDHDSKGEDFDYVYVDQYEDCMTLGSGRRSGMSPEQFLMWVFLRTQIDGHGW